MGRRYTVPMQQSSSAALRNREPILATITPYLRACATLFEVGSGTGEHAVHCAAALPWLRWQASEMPARLAGLSAVLAGAGLPNLPPPLGLDVRSGPWPAATVDAVFTANTLHCMSWPAAEALFAGVAHLLGRDGVLLIYGPFNRDGAFTSDGNQRLDAWARGLDPAFGLRDRDAVIALAAGHGFSLCDDHPMPANNHLLAWRCSGHRYADA